MAGHVYDGLVNKKKKKKIEFPFFLKNTHKLVGHFLRGEKNESI